MNLRFRRNLRDSEKDDLANLLIIIQSFQIVPSCSDIWVWSLSSSGAFSVFSFYSAVSSSSSSSPFSHRIIWFFLSPSKVQEFLRKSASNLGTTLDIVQAFYPILPCFQTIAPCASPQLSPMPIHLSIAPLVGGFGINFLNWLTSVLLTRFHWLTFSPLGDHSFSEGAQGNYGSYVYMA